MPKSVNPVTVIIKKFIRIVNFRRFKTEVKEPEIYSNKPTNDETVNSNIYDVQNTLPFLIRGDLSDYATGSFIYNPVGSEKLLKKIADDLAATFIFTDDAGEPVIADKEIIAACGTSADQLAAIAEQNIQKLFQERRLVTKNLDNNNVLYTILLNSRNEASCMFSKKIWASVSAKHKDHIFVSAPRFNEMHYCTLRGNAVADLISYTVRRFNNAGNQALSPNIYLYHNSSWVMFANGPGQVRDYCLKHGLVK
jgi:hypothetical protein